MSTALFFLLLCVFENFNESIKIRCYTKPTYITEDKMEAQGSQRISQAHSTSGSSFLVAASPDERSQNSHLEDFSWLSQVCIWLCILQSLLGIQQKRAGLWSKCYCSPLPFISMVGVGSRGSQVISLLPTNKSGSGHRALLSWSPRLNFLVTC